MGNEGFLHIYPCFPFSTENNNRKKKDKESQIKTFYQSLLTLSIMEDFLLKYIVLEKGNHTHTKANQSSTQWR